MKYEDWTYTVQDLHKMWERPPAEQLLIAQKTILKTILQTEGEIGISFSGGKDSCLILDMYCEVLSKTKYRDKPVKIYFADTTNETIAMYKFIPRFLEYLKIKYPNANLELTTVRPDITWVEFTKNNGIPLISKDVAHRIATVTRDLKKSNIRLSDALSYYKTGKDGALKLYDMGLSYTATLNLTGYAYNNDCETKRWVIPLKWLPLLECPVPLTDKCCLTVKEKPLKKLDKLNPCYITGEQAAESQRRKHEYLKTGCIATVGNGKIHSKPLGPMTLDGILYGIKSRNIPICPDYGEIIEKNGCFKCSKSNRTGCALCGFGTQIDTDRFVRLAETEPAKVKYAFKPREEGGLGYREAITFCNENCKTKILIP